MNRETHSVLLALQAFERRMTLRLYAVAAGIVLAVALLRHFWTS